MFSRSGNVQYIIVYIAIVFAWRIESITRCPETDQKCDCIWQQSCHFITRSNVKECASIGQCEDFKSIGSCTRGNKDDTYYIRDGRLCASKELEDVGDCAEDTSYKYNQSIEISSCAGVNTTIDEVGVYEFTLETAPLTWGENETYKYYDVSFSKWNINFRIRKEDFPTEGQVVKVIAELAYRERRASSYIYREFSFNGLSWLFTPTKLEEPPNNFEKNYYCVICPMEYCFPTIYAGEIRRFRLIRFVNQSIIEI